MLNAMISSQCVSVDYITISEAGTWPDKMTWVSALDEDKYIIQVQACESVYIALSSIPANPRTQTYEIALGINGNTLTEIRGSVGGAGGASYSRAILSCDSMQSFWLRHLNGFVEFGRGGVVGLDRIVQWHDTEGRPHEVNAIGVSAGPNVTATWQLSYLPSEWTTLFELMSEIYRAKQRYTFFIGKQVH